MTDHDALAALLRDHAERAWPAQLAAIENGGGWNRWDHAAHFLEAAGVRVTGDAGLDAAWRAVEAVLPKSKGPWGYSIHGLKYTTRGWCAIAAGARTGEWVEGFGATPVDALNALRAALTGDTPEAQP